jgi:hypothetical protein
MRENIIEKDVNSYDLAIEKLLKIYLDLNREFNKIRGIFLEAGMTQSNKKSF